MSFSGLPLLLRQVVHHVRFQAIFQCVVRYFCLNTTSKDTDHKMMFQLNQCIKILIIFQYGSS